MKILVDHNVRHGVFRVLQEFVYEAETAQHNGLESLPELAVVSFSRNASPRSPERPTSTDSAKRSARIRFALFPVASSTGPSHPSIKTKNVRHRRLASHALSVRFLSVGGRTDGSLDGWAQGGR
jgi:hypothetical protein